MCDKFTFGSYGVGQVENIALWHIMPRCFGNGTEMEIWGQGSLFLEGLINSRAIRTRWISFVLTRDVSVKSICQLTNLQLSTFQSQMSTSFAFLATSRMYRYDRPICYLKSRQVWIILIGKQTEMHTTASIQRRIQVWCTSRNDTSRNEGIILVLLGLLVLLNVEEN